jgi:hypothetical protein
MLLPIILRLLGRFEGIPKYTGLELSLMTRYFIFLFVVCFKFLNRFPSPKTPYSNPSSWCPSLPGLSPPFKFSRATQGQFPQPWPRTYPRHPRSSSRKLSLSTNQFIPNPYIFSPQFYGLPVFFRSRCRLPSNYYVKLFPLGSTSRSIRDQVHTRTSSSMGNIIPELPEEKLAWKIQ